jgi:hypothetical protein
MEGCAANAEGTGLQDWCVVGVRACMHAIETQDVYVMFHILFIIVITQATGIRTTRR